MASPRSRRETADYYRDRRRRKVCNFCVDKAESIDYKEVNRLRRYLSERAKIEPRRKTGTCARHQRSVTVAIKRARYRTAALHRRINRRQGAGSRSYPAKNKKKFLLPGALPLADFFARMAAEPQRGKA